MLTLEQQIGYMGAIRPEGSEEKSLPTVSGYRAKAVTKYVAGTTASLLLNNGRIIRPETLKAVGTTNFETGNRLPKGTRLLVTGIRTLWDVTAAATTADANWDGAIPVACANGEFEITQKGQGTLFSASGTDVSNFKASTGNDADFRDVVPFILRDQTEFQIVFSVNGTPAVGVYKVELRCIELTEGDTN
jgi:hypothetical protein